MERGRMVVSGTIDEVQRQVMGGTVLRIEVIGEPGRLMAILEADPHADSVDLADGVYSVRYRGDAVQTSVLLSTLVREGVGVVSFARQREGLEDLFLKVGAKELS
jgi:ABC-2 type transport system ATP-binding protein